MKRDIKKFTQTPYDVLIIGGGINGAAIAHMAALNGLTVALLEKGDFASGTSSKSTKLIHGGLRYLEHLDFDLVRESLRERAVQLKSAPHLVHPLRFIIPVYDSDKRPLWMMKLGVWLYDTLSGKYVVEKHRNLTVDEICERVPGIKREGLVGGVMYSDAQMNDARLCLENVLSARENGAHVANYAKVLLFSRENGKAVGVLARDELTQENFQVRARKIICAVGPWTNSLMKKEQAQAPSPVRPTKGVHIVCKGRVSANAILLPTQTDGRIFFVIPWGENSLIGTTDTDFSGDPDEVRPQMDDIGYLLKEARRVLPEGHLDHGKIITSFAGLRPLVYEFGSPQSVSRKHVIKESYSGLIYVIGGKYTTYRKIAEEVIKKICKKPLKNTCEYFPVYGSGNITQGPREVGREYDIDSLIVKKLMDFYGVRFRNVLDLVKSNASLKKPICSCSSVIGAQVLYAIQTEMAHTVEDVVMRRLLIGYQGCPTEECHKSVQDKLSGA